MAQQNKTKSMTAFAHARLLVPQGTLMGELRAVNNRFLDINIRLPESLRIIEPKVRELLREHLQRGKLDLSIRLEQSEQAPTLTVNQPLLDALLQTAQQISAQSTCPGQINIIDILRWPGVLKNQADDASLEAAALRLAQTLLEQFQEDRAREGAALQEVIVARLDQINTHIAAIVPLASQILPLQREKLVEKLKLANIEFDQYRLEQELIYWAQKADIDEELDRLATHVQEMYTTLKKGGAVGRRLDFLVQELHRETNTLGVKALTQEMAEHALEMKVLIEQIREQVQNLE